MKRFFLFFLSSLILTSFTNAADKSYVEGDGSLDFTCTQDDVNARPFNIFDLTFMYDENSPKDLFDMLADDNLGSGNGDFVYQMQMTQYPYYGAEIAPFSQTVTGCEFAPMQLTVKENGNFQIYFECDADGDAGYGEFEIDMNTFTGTGKINFPEGKSDLMFPLIEDTEVSISCKSTDLY